METQLQQMINQANSINAELFEDYNVDYDKNLITFTDQANYTQFKKLNGQYMCNGQNLPKLISETLFNCEVWYTYVILNNVTQRFAYNSSGSLMKYVSSTGRWYDQDDEELLDLSEDEIIASQIIKDC